MVIFEGIESVIQVQILDEALCVSLGGNIPGEGMDLFTLPHHQWVDCMTELIKQPKRRRKIMNSNQL